MGDKTKVSMRTVLLKHGSERDGVKGQTRDSR